MPSNHYDVIVIGGGHNGLVNAAYFARAGVRPVVLEAREQVGGAADTSAPFPEHPEIKASTYSYVVSVLPGFVMRDLRLDHFGLKVEPVEMVSHPLPDGGAIETFNNDLQRTCDSIARFSKRDAEVFPEWLEWIDGVCEAVAPLLLQVPPPLGSLSPGDLLEQARLAWKLRKLGHRGVADVTKIFTLSMTDLIDSWFDSEELKGALALGGVIGTWGGPDAPGSAFMVLHSGIADVDGTMGSWGYPRGGMGAVSTAMRRSAESAGAEIRTGARVARNLTKGDRVEGVALESGEELRAPVVVSAIHPKIAFLQLLDRRELPGDFVRDIEHWKTRSGTVKINLALSELPDFRAHPGTQLQEHHAGSLNLGLSPAQIERAFQDAHIDHRASAAPFSEGCIPSVLDPTLAPEGFHVMSLFTQWVPHEWSREPHREELEAYADRVVDLYTDLAPNLRGAIIGRQVLGPYDFEQELGLVGGNIYHGELTPDQLFHMRPAAGYADYRTPIRGLYHASSATHAGGGVNGIPGYQAFRQATRDKAVRRT
ncbi:MAG: phytoene desaturase family protein [Planctomycetota bacterium]|jgi:phytoene dehydrogenase-like protein